jgi:hypothetical protein
MSADIVVIFTVVLSAVLALLVAPALPPRR